MKDDKDEGQRQSGKDAKNLRRERLKLALRENLKRRRSQHRGRGEFTNVSSNSDDLAEGNPGEKHPGK
jgi:hypothetical protein